MQGISEAFLLPVLELLMTQFPFEVVGFHSDNGSEYINKQVAQMLNKLNIEQTKSRARHSNDLRPGQEMFNPWLNLHRPCMFATKVVSPKGKIIKRYLHEDVKTLECLALLDKQGLVKFKKGNTL